MWLSYTRQILALKCRVRGFKHAGGGFHFAWGLKKGSRGKRNTSNSGAGWEEELCVGKEINTLQF